MTKKQTNVPFGFKDIPPEEKTKNVQALFNRVASSYDLMNDLMSAGLHRLWKNELIETLRPEPHMEILDMAGGTGDIAFGILKAQPSANVTVCDLTPGMLEVGQKRARKLGHTSLQWVCADAAKLPFANDSFDAYTISFGLRNVTEVKKALHEAHRVLKPGGRFLCLEFSHVQYPIVDKLYETYSFKVIPKMGKWIAQDQAAYQYLVESIARFPSQNTLKHMLEDAEFTNVTYTNFSGGIAAIHSGWKI